VKEVLITRPEANAAKARGITPMEHLVERFEKEHGLTFSVKDFDDTTRFEYREGLNADVFKVVYKGEPS
jgi:hypothetical protein